MVGLWDWFRSKGRANAKPVQDDDTDAPMPRPREAKPHQVKATINRAEDKWSKDGERADQDYYHVPGGTDQGLKGAPEAHTDPIRKPRNNAPRSKLPR